MMKFPQSFVFAILWAVACIAPAAAQQSAFRNRSVCFVAPFSAGGTADVLARIIAQRLGPVYAQQVIVDNRPGSGGHVGAELTAKAPPEGTPEAAEEFFAAEREKWTKVIKIAGIRGD